MNIYWQNCFILTLIYLQFLIYRLSISLLRPPLIRLLIGLNIRPSPGLICSSLILSTCLSTNLSTCFLVYSFLALSSVSPGYSSPALFTVSPVYSSLSLSTVSPIYLSLALTTVSPAYSSIAQSTGSPGYSSLSLSTVSSVLNNILRTRESVSLSPLH